MPPDAPTCGELGVLVREGVVFVTKTPVLAGLDVGTTNVKALALTADGRVLASSSVRLDVEYPRPGWAEYDPETLWQTAAAAFRELVQKLPDDAQVVGVAACSMAETAIPLDASGQPVRKAIAWFDNRTREQVEWWQREMGPDRVYQVTGVPLQPIFGILKLQWLQRHEPHVFQRIRRWLNVADYVAYRLCGQQATDFSLATRTMALDLRALQWSDQMLEAAQIPRQLMADLAPSGTALGPVTLEAARVCGLPAGAMVAVGGHDHPCAALGAGVIGPGRVLDSMGTAEALLMVTESPCLDPRLGRAGYSEGAHVVEGRFYSFGGLYTSGASMEWIRTVLLPEVSDIPEAYRRMEAMAREVPPGSLGVHFLPHLRLATPPYDDPLARGCFVGLTTDVTPGTLVRAVLEGLAYDAHHTLQVLQELLNHPTRHIRAVGGSTRNRLLMEIKAALSPVPYTVADIDEAGARGACLLAGVAAGVFPSLEQAVDQVGTPESPVPVRAEWVEGYRQRYQEVYVHLYPAVARVHQTISSRFAS